MPSPTKESEVSPVDTNLIRFEIRDGSRRVSCTVSNDVLDCASGLTAPSPSFPPRKSFDRFRTMVHAAAMLKAKEAPCETPIVVTYRDLCRVPPDPETRALGAFRRTR